MRELKFRLIWGGRIVGYEFHHQGEIPSGMTLRSEGTSRRHSIYRSRAIDGIYQNISDDSHRCIICERKDQYTGLLDRNGVEIFEGDWVKMGDGEKSIPAIVRFGFSECTCRHYDDHNDLRFLGWHLDGLTDCEEELYGGKVEVIGNVWEHPGLPGAEKTEKHGG